VAATIDDFKELLRKGIRDLMASDFEGIESSFWDVIEELIDAGELDTGPDHKLGGRFLEAKVRSIFRRMGFSVDRGPAGLHDATIEPPEDVEPQKPLVIEVKSSRNTTPTRTDLRQLDDWVFELSGEERARKHGLGGGPSGESLASGGVITPIRRHPSPHKGIMVFNGPVGVPFEKRPGIWLGANEKEFAEKRDFCITRFEILLAWGEAVKGDPSQAAKLWKAMHACAGELTEPGKET